jgi:hypothetical protein
MTRDVAVAGALIAVAMLAGAACGDPVSTKDATATARVRHAAGTASVAATFAAPEATLPPSTATLPPEAIASMTPATSQRKPTASAASATRPPYTGPTRVMEDFNTLPKPPWYNPPTAGSGATVSHGILTLDGAAGAANEFILQEASYPNGAVPAANVWDSAVSNGRGWWVEVKMRVDPLTDEQCASGNKRGPALTLWATDDTQMLVRVGFSSSCMALVYAFDKAITVPMDTTSTFHVYRISTRLKHVEVSVDGLRVIQHDYGLFEETGTGLVFGDGQSGYGPTRSYWDYVTYDVSGPSP